MEAGRKPLIAASVRVELRPRVLQPAPGRVSSREKAQAVLRALVQLLFLQVVPASVQVWAGEAEFVVSQAQA